MAYIQKIEVDITTDGTGDAVVYTGILNGKVSAIAYVKTDFANGTHVSVVNTISGDVIWYEANVNAAKVVHPRDSWTTTGGGAGDLQAGMAYFVITDARLIFTIATGGATKSGKFFIYLE